MSLYASVASRLPLYGLGMSLVLAAPAVSPQGVKTIPLSKQITLDGIFALPSGDLLGASAWNGSSLWQISRTGEVTELASGLRGPIHVTQDPAGNRYLSNYSDSGTISKVTPDGKIATFAKVPQGPSGLAWGPDGKLYAAIFGNVQGSGNAIFRIDAAGKAEVFVAEQGLSGPVGLTFDSAGNLYSANGIDGRVFRTTPDGVISLFTTLPKGRGVFSAGHLAYAGGPIFASGNSSQVIHLITPDGKNCVFAGSGTRGTKDGALREADFTVPNGLAVSPDHRTLYVVNGGGGVNEVFRRIDLPPRESLRCS